MNKLDLEELLVKYRIEVRNYTSRSNIEDIHWNAEHSTMNSALFYFFFDNSHASQERFQTRLKNAKYEVLIVNKLNKALTNIENYIVLKDEDFYALQLAILDFLYPLSKLAKIYAVTGTNGKTTTVDFCRQIANHYNIKAFSIGTLGVIDHKGENLSTIFTTPPLIELRKYLNIYFREHDVCFMEVSSHALAQNRVLGLNFNSVAWTNFTQDHLDYHHTMEEYFKEKLKILDHLKDEGKCFAPETQKYLREKLKNKKVVFVSPVEPSRENHSFLGVKYNCENLSLAKSLIEDLLSKKINDSFEYIIPPPGRFQEIIKYGKKVIVDYAHTPDALKNICAAIKKHYPNKNLVVLFGCGGNRDVEKRPLMANAAEVYADRIIITSDNPRFEDPEQIMKDIACAINRRPFVCIKNRRQAIEAGFNDLKANEILLVAGKGHETTQEINGVKYPFNDINIIQGINN